MREFMTWLEEYEDPQQRAHQIVTQWTGDENNYEGIVSDIDYMGWTSIFALDAAPNESVDVLKAIDAMLWDEFGRYVSPDQLPAARAERDRIKSITDASEFATGTEKSTDWRKTMDQVASRASAIPPRRPGTWSSTAQ